MGSLRCRLQYFRFFEFLVSLRYFLPDLLDIQGHLPVVQFLSEAGADVNLPDENLSCGVHKATLYDQHECLLVLLRYNADPDVKTSRGWTALHLAAECGHVSCVDALISHKVGDSTSFFFLFFFFWGGGEVEGRGRS